MKTRVILVTAVGAATGSREAAAALAGADSEADRPGLLIDVGGRAPRPTLLASAGARELEERLAVHLPALCAASRGQICHLAVGDDPDCFESVRAALPLARDSVAVLHVPPSSFRVVLTEPGIDTAGVLLRADLDADRALTALAVRDLVARRLRVKVLAQPLVWLAARRALFGALPATSAGGLPKGIVQSFLESEISAAHACYSEKDDAEIDPEGTAEQQRRGNESPRQGRGVHSDPEWGSGR
jgi:hypothetical protein